MRARWRGIIPGLILGVGLLLPEAAFGQDDAGNGAGLGTYPDIVQEKVGEVSEIRYKELVDSKLERQEREKALMRLALYRYFQGDFAGSEYYLRRLIGRFGETEEGREARIWLGRTYLARGEYGSALVELSSGLEELDDSLENGDDLAGRYLFWIGEAYRQSGKAADARHYFESFQRRVPGHPLSSVLRGRLAETYRELGIDPSTVRIETPPSEERRPPTPGSFRVRIASFSKKGNASKLVRELGAAGYEADIEEVSLESGRFYRVVLGGYDDRGQAEEVAKKVRREGYSMAYVEGE